MIVFLAFSVILVTLVLQGLTLPPLIRALGLAGVADPSTEESEVRRAMVEAAIKFLRGRRKEDDDSSAEIYDDLLHQYEHRLSSLDEAEVESALSSGPHFYRRQNEVLEAALVVERQVAVRFRNQRRISDELLRTLEYELDLSETRLLGKKE